MPFVIDENLVSLLSCVFTGLYTLITVIIAFYAYKAYQISLNQGQIENSFKLVSLVQESLNEIKLCKEIPLLSYGQAEIVIQGMTLLHKMMENQVDLSCRPPKGRWQIRFVSPKAFPWQEHMEILKNSDYVDPYLFFTSPSADEGLLRECCELFNLIGKNVCTKSADVGIIYFYLGQYIRVIFRWLTASEGAEENFKKMYPYYWKMFKKYEKNFDGWIEKALPVRTQAKEVFISTLSSYPQLIPSLSSSLKTSQC